MTSSHWKAMYEQASDYAQMDGQAGSQLSKCNSKVAALAAVLEKYDRAIELYEEIADAYVENDLLKFSCKEFYLKASLSDNSVTTSPPLPRIRSRTLIGSFVLLRPDEATNPSATSRCSSLLLSLFYFR